jgi:Flp pilus assembly protein TadD
VVFVGLGVFVMAKFGMLGSKSPKKLPPPIQTVQKPPQPPVQQKITSAKSPAVQPTVAKITLGEPSAPEPVKKKAKAHKIKDPNCPPPGAVVPKAVAARPARKVEPLPAHQSQKAAPPPRKIDTAARDSYLYAARSAEQKADWKGALASYRKAQEIDPDDYKIMSNMAAVLNNLGMFEDGVQEAERALSKKPDYVPALINAAIGYSSTGNAQKALRHFTFARALDPGNRSLTINLGILQERTGMLDDAQVTYRQLAGSGDPLALQGMGRVYERKGNKSEAVRIYRQLMALPAASAIMKKEAKNKLARLEE